MLLPIFIISIPISSIFFILGYLFLTNKLDCKNYGIEFFFFAEQPPIINTNQMITEGGSRVFINKFEQR